MKNLSYYEIWQLKKYGDVLPAEEPEEVELDRTPFEKAEDLLPENIISESLN